MEPVEINAGDFYLRGLRSDDRVDDLAWIREVHPGADAAYLERRRQGWADETFLTWASCRQTDIDLLAEITCEVAADGTARVSGWARPGVADAEGALEAGRSVVTRFAEGALGLTVLDGR